MQRIEFGPAKLQIPDDWHVQENSECLTMKAQDNSRGAVQISTVTKDVGVVDETDLLEFATERLDAGVLLQKTRTPHLTGITATYRNDGFFWQEWWLCVGQKIFYVTYNVDVAFEGLEAQNVWEIVQSIQSK